MYQLTYPPLSFKVLIDAVKCISKSKYKQNSGQKTNNDIYKILHRKLRIEKHLFHTRNGCELNCPGRVSSSYSTGIKVSWYIKPFWHDGHNIYTQNSSTLGVQSNVNEDDTRQWKLWIGIYLKCIHEQGDYFLHNSKNKRKRWINLLLYQWSKN
jgi:hypothetical protein